ncbi:MAG: thymidylate synthase [Pseudomonadota bacterium]|uniref:thymidylate synthase n=1 Tax=Phenylobacterium sp. TaxID=1871053 RepID=UPI0025D392B9|nr:thymidylate synthase [Phenylobacterium sp.]MBT9473842.1 hypothetical protein [Phenylobacterium sp.]
MRSERYRNISCATVGGFEAVLRDGKAVDVRGEATRELLGRGTLIERPDERFPFLPGRLGDPFALVAETLWVLAGRNDIEWLGHYLPRAAAYADNGRVWRAGYGPRLRNWNGVDQLMEVYRLLEADRTSRRGVMSLFDPATDFGNSKDIPCNNWLSWLIRDDELLLNVAVRSNDAMWGFSGINAFEWSVLQEVLASWLGVKAGPVYFLASSFHLYERGDHLKRAADVVAHFPRRTPYELGVETPRFAVPPAQFDRALADWFAAEERIRLDPDASLEIAITDPFLLAALRTVRLKWGAAVWDVDRLRDELSACPDDDFTAAAYERLARPARQLLSDIPQPACRRYFQTVQSEKTPMITLKTAIDRLHRKKNAAYGGAWKRRGERVSILPNIARKIDRLAHFQNTSLEIEGETRLDTAIDLFVYVLKYELFLAQDSPRLAAALGLAGAPRSYSDFDDDFTTALDLSTVDQSGDENDSVELAAAVELFEELWPRVDSGESLEAKAAGAAQLRRHAERLVSAIAKAHPSAADAFVRTWDAS